MSAFVGLGMMAVGLIGLTFTLLKMVVILIVGVSRAVASLRRPLAPPNVLEPEPLPSISFEGYRAVSEALEQ
jgi:hypothetical protein